MRAITGTGTSSLRNSAAPICNRPPMAVIYHETNAIGDTSAGEMTAPRYEKRKAVEP